MKFFIIMHSQIMMTQATIINSPEHWFPREVNRVKDEMQHTVNRYYEKGDLTEYQRGKLLALIETIEPPYR